MKTIGIFRGKQKDWNVRVLTLLYDNGPLTAWELTGKIRKIGRQSLHATLNKRLRALEAKFYVRREDKKWILRLKGFIAVLLIQKEPRMWNPIWKEIFDSKAKIIEEYELKYKALKIICDKYAFGKSSKLTLELVRDLESLIIIQIDIQHMTGKKSPA